MKKTLTLLLLLAAFVTQSYAHALWIETPTQGKKGVAQTVKIFFGEYASKEMDSTAKWYSNLKDFKLVLTSPDGQQQQLTPKANTLYYEATFTPEKDGHYILSVVHHVKDLYEDAKIEYYALANVFVGKASAKNTLSNNVQLSIAPTKASFAAGQENAHLVKLNGQAFKNQKITLVGPDKKSETLETSVDGKISFAPQQKGPYFLEAFYEDKKTGTHEGKNFAKVWHVVTYTAQAI